MTTFKEEEKYSTFREIGRNTKANFRQVEKRGSDSCFSGMETNTKDSSEMIILGERVECLNKTER